MLDAYAAHLLSLAPVTGRRLKVVVDAGNGMAGHTAPAVFGPAADDRGVELVAMYFELDGTFPNHEANPIEPANLVDLQARVVAEGPTSGSPSTATPTAASSSTSGARPCRRRR